MNYLGVTVTIVLAGMGFFWSSVGAVNQKIDKFGVEMGDLKVKTASDISEIKTNISSIDKTLDRLEKKIK